MTLTHIPPITSVAEAKAAILTGQITEKTMIYLIQAFDEIKKDAQTKHQIFLEQQARKKQETLMPGDYKHLLNQQGMTDQDNVNMGRVVSLLLDNEMDTPEIMEWLENIKYTPKYIEAWVKRTRKNLKVEPNGEDIIQVGDETYFEFNVLREQNRLLAQKGMEIPREDVFIDIFTKLIWIFWKDKRYTWANILWFILDIPRGMYCESWKKMDSEGNFGCIRIFSSGNSPQALCFKFYNDKGSLSLTNKRNALPVRAIYK